MNVLPSLLSGIGEVWSFRRCLGSLHLAKELLPMYKLTVLKGFGGLHFWKPN